jgi:hypothetical protein
VRLRNFEPLVFPGLAQTEDYARSVISTRIGVFAEKAGEAVCRDR